MSNLVFEIGWISSTISNLINWAKPTLQPNFILNRHPALELSMCATIETVHKPHAFCLTPDG
jgi:hypothetical protein